MMGLTLGEGISTILLSH